MNKTINGQELKNNKIQSSPKEAFHLKNAHNLKKEYLSLP